MARVTKGVLDSLLQWTAITLLGVVLALGATYLIRRVNAAETHAKRAESDLAAFKTTLIEELREARGEQPRKVALQVVRNTFAAVTALLSGAWVARIAQALTPAATAGGGAFATGVSNVPIMLTGGLLVVATGAAVLTPAVRPPEQRPPPAAAARQSPTPRHLALPAAPPTRVATTPPTTPATPTGTPTPTLTTPTPTRSGPAPTTRTDTTATPSSTPPPSSAPTPVAASVDAAPTPSAAAGVGTPTARVGTPAEAVLPTPSAATPAASNAQPARHGTCPRLDPVLSICV